MKCSLREVGKVWDIFYEEKGCFHNLRYYSIEIKKCPEMSGRNVVILYCKEMFQKGITNQKQPMGPGSA